MAEATRFARAFSNGIHEIMLKKNKKSGQEIQDEIFRKMTPDKKVELGSGLWLLAKELAKEKICYRVPWPAKARPGKPLRPWNQ